ncbi:MAG: hypothetical protein GWN58_33200 [Anaerolineae bacterium]|nr:hypothetical protein [Thermoplasmata archaeon]NIV34133.1 hypothetical protein [Anaerolineae bacterium]NIY05984.1 hypothetical protein [Thermoplasmata archaeon]
MLDKLAREQGFENEQEMHHMIASVDLTHDATRLAFLAWKETDGSKEGLEAVLKTKEGGGGTPTD